MMITKIHVMMTKIHGPSIATQWLQILRDYALLFDDSASSRRISQIAPEKIPISSEERKNSSEESTETSEESNHKSEEFFRSSVENVLFLKKVHSWGGITETVHGSFLSVL